MRGFLLLGCATLMLSTLPSSEVRERHRTRSTPGLIPVEFLRFFPVRDTIYTLSQRYLELDLQRQRLYLYERNGGRYQFKVSSGAPWVPKGMETPTGLFTLQTKATMAISRQFDNIPMLYWMGFSGNIGFHALEGWSYYRHLGHRASSHGCVRLSREDARFLYRLLPRGTPVLVHKEAPARVLAFLDPEEFIPGHDWLLNSGDDAQRQLLRARLEVLYSGQFYRKHRRRLVLSGSTILRPGGYEVGSARLIPPQEPPLMTTSLQFFCPPPVSLARWHPLLALTADSTSRR